MHYVANQPTKASEHFYGLREAKHDLLGIAIFDRLEKGLRDDPGMRQIMWSRRELENYICQEETLLAYAESCGREQQGPLFGSTWRETMRTSIREIETALETLGSVQPWGPDIKASDEFLTPVFKNFYSRLGLPNLMRKTDFHALTPFVPGNAIDDEIVKALDAIAQVASQVKTSHP